MTEGKEMRLAGMKMSKRVALMVATTAVLVPAFAFAVETDRITVEDQTSGAVMFRVTSGGNVTGASFTGDGAGLTNVPHYKGAWSAATTYNKDETVFYNGSSYIALKQSLNADPTVDATSWAVFANKGADGAAGSQGPAGPQGLQGIQGIQGLPGTNGSPDTQSQILAKLATPTTGAVLSVQQAAGEAATASKLSIKDSTGLEKLTFSLDGALNLIGGTNQKMFSDGPNARSVFAAFRARGTAAVPTTVQNNDKIGTFQFSGYDGSAYQTSALLEGFVDGTVAAGSVPMRLSIVTGTGVSNRAERLIVKSTGNVGVGTASPTQKLEVNGGLRINTATAKPTCDTTSRGTFWVTQNGAGVMDTLEVCVKDATDAYVWKAVW